MKIHLRDKTEDPENWQMSPHIALAIKDGLWTACSIIAVPGYLTDDPAQVTCGACRNAVPGPHGVVKFRQQQTAIERTSLIDELVPAVLGKGRQLQILVRMQGSRPDKPHDVWYVIQIVKQTHRGIMLTPKISSIHGVGDAWMHRTKNNTKVMLHSGTDAAASTPRIWTAHDGGIHFNVWNAMGTLDNIPMIIDEREYEAVREAVEAYNQEFSKIDPEEVAQI